MREKCKMNELVAEIEKVKREKEKLKGSEAHYGASHYQNSEPED